MACERCNGAGFLTPDVPIEDSRFGSLVLCPNCQGMNDAVAPYISPWDDNSEDPYDFPLSLSWRAFYGARGTMPAYPDAGPTPAELRLDDAWQAVIQDANQAGKHRALPKPPQKQLPPSQKPSQDRALPPPVVESFDQ